jgi:phosphoribosylaminoimidazole-succinocarboxamide synthase
MPVLLESYVPNVPCRRGKVRDVYDLGNMLVLVATDRISAFDWVLPTGIPDKGRILTELTLFWVEQLQLPYPHPAPDDFDLPEAFAHLRERSCLVSKREVVPIECVVRGYLAGSGWKEYQASQSVCGVALPPGLRQAEKLPEPIFTPATKEESGHDQNISFAEMCDRVGSYLSEELRDRSLDIYHRAAAHAESKGILLADTKFEWGRDSSGRIWLIDEVLTPDSSRFWPADQYRVGTSPPSFDKQFVRDWLESTPWDKNSPPPPLPADVVEKTRQKYVEALQRLTSP